ncbi:Amidase signature (AS) enzyme [Venustampulla echinocandica]|uniref:amidase n=1 Tax=Venustampulla echinocandica TaxID=2656787 RepID=A0A370TEQ4_9HELO|nr:Amidase signature (AS) enzyme [Venustampulla echinocandica]RDL33172.1 Amidase signature (AS) enzyme [Venustampulla echinocandica]
MAFLSDYLQHRRDCKFKQSERAQRIRDLNSYHGPFTAPERKVLSKPIEELVQDVHKQVIQPIDILRAYGKAAIKAHEKTNCITEVMIGAAESWVADESINVKGPLAGIPVSLKDTIVVGGFDTTVGYSSNVGNKVEKDGGMVKLLKDAGAVPYVKTNLPITLLSFESTNDVWGRCTNPHNDKYSPGGSTGGESALLAAGGGRIGIGSDVAGSVRVPAHFSGIYALRCSTGRWPKAGILTSMPGQEGIPSVFSPMARTLGDLTYFTKSLISMEPWKYDHSVHPISWRPEIEREIQQTKKFRVGLLKTDGVVDPSPACARALDEVVAALRKAGHEVIDINPPSPYEALCLASQLLNSDGCKTFKSFQRTGEWMDPGVKQMSWLMSLASPFKWIYYLWVKYVRRDEIWAGIVQGWKEKSAYEQWKLVAKREAYKAQWHEWWEQETKIDFMITPPNATPAVPHDGMHDAVSSCGYTFLFNMLDYSSGVMPITHVDKSLDQLPETFNIKKLNGVAQGAYKHYDATAMHGLPVGIQVVGQRLQEEKVLAVMKRIEEALGNEKYQLLEID